MLIRFLQLCLALLLMMCTSSIERASGSAAILPMESLPDMIVQSELGCIGTVVSYTHVKEDASFRVEVGRLLIEVKQVFRREGRGVRSKTPKYIEAVLASRYRLKTFKKGESHMFFLRWSSPFQMFVLLHGSGMQGNLPMRVSGKVVKAMLSDSKVEKLVQYSTADRKGKHNHSKAERLTATITYFVRFYRHMLVSAEASYRLNDPKALDSALCFEDHDVGLNIDSLSPESASRMLEDSQIKTEWSYVYPLVKAGYVEECRELQKVLSRLAMKCSDEELKSLLKSKAQMFDGCRKWPEWIREWGKVDRDKAGSRAGDTDTGIEGIIIQVVPDKE